MDKEKFEKDLLKNIGIDEYLLYFTGDLDSIRYYLKDRKMEKKCLEVRDYLYNLIDWSKVPE